MSTALLGVPPVCPSVPLSHSSSHIVSLRPGFSSFQPAPRSASLFSNAHTNSFFSSTLTLAIKSTLSVPLYGTLLSGCAPSPASGKTTDDRQRTVTRPQSLLALTPPISLHQPNEVSLSSTDEPSGKILYSDTRPVDTSE